MSAAANSSNPFRPACSSCSSSEAQGSWTPWPPVVDAMAPPGKAAALLLVIRRRRRRRWPPPDVQVQPADDPTSGRPRGSWWPPPEPLGLGLMMMRHGQVGRWRRDRRHGAAGGGVGDRGRGGGALGRAWLGLPQEGHGAGAEAIVYPEGCVGHVWAIPWEDPRAE